MSKTYFVTGAAGFIGFHLCKKLLQEKNKVIGLDNLNSYYDISLKQARLNELNKQFKQNSNLWDFKKGDINDISLLDKIFENYNPEFVINLAAQAGVRNSIDNPESYLSSNILGFGNILECCKKYNIEHLVYASSSSVYGDKNIPPYSEKDKVDSPVSLYAATKKANELMAHAYSHLFKIPSSGIRFFTVYGPWGRPDMAPMIFTKSIFSQESIKVYNNGDMSRDFTYIDDAIEFLSRIITIPPIEDQDNKNPYRIVNIGNSTSINLMKFIDTLETEIGIKSKKNFLGMQLGDVKRTNADTKYIEELTNYKAQTNLSNGIKSFINWYKLYYKK